MPRTARVKSSECIYHIMSRSISEINLFQCDEDKNYYLALLKRYKEKYKCSIYAYCIMDNHMHLFINPNGFDISTFMHCLNSAYVSYFNRKYNRHGHLFQGRFASTIVDSNAYAISLSAYIHNNSKDIDGYNGMEHLYAYSSYGIYLGIQNDRYDLIDKKFILDQFSKVPEKAVKLYQRFVTDMKESGISNVIDEDIVTSYIANEYRSEKKIITRDVDPDTLVKKVLRIMGIQSPAVLKNKYSRKDSHIRAFIVYAMRILCGYKFREICEYIGNITMSGVTKLSMKGFYLTVHDERCQKAMKSLLQLV
ncbi:MAG TPA: transposase [Clostridiaceae bacterium]|nr:transposase [Clostridiaceae bacterium]HHV99073.1 transposase [Clostridiaceae bacterium]